MKEKIKKWFISHPQGRIKARQLAGQLDITHEYEYEQLKATLHQLTVEGFLMREGKRFSLLSQKQETSVTGILELNEKGYGFVVPKNKDLEDIFIPERCLGTALHGDEVEVALFAMPKGKGKRKAEGEITAVLNRRMKDISGTLRKSKSLYYVEPDTSGHFRDIYVAGEHLNGAREGDRVIVGEIVWENPKLNPEGKVLRVVSAKDKLYIEATAVARELGIPVEFSKDSLNESEQFPEKVTEADLEGRIDFRDVQVFTIDPEDAKDFDDALSLEVNEEGNYRIGIHIADVSHYVTPGSKLDEEARRRGNSTYLVGTVLPMLPERLSNKLCSLVPNEDRLTFSVVVEMTPRGKLLSSQIAKTVIHSKRRFTYEEAQQVIETGEGDLKEYIVPLNKLARLLRAKRMKAGSINFAAEEIKFKLDENGKPISVVKKVQKESNELVEEYMLLANQITAMYAGKGKKKKPLIYRIHGEPDPEKLKDFVAFVRSMGKYQFAPAKGKISEAINKLMLEVKGQPEETVINEVAIRSQAKAVYSANNIGHFGLGFPFYAHFTSPIRRYADLIVHRLLFEYLNEKNPSVSGPELERISDHISGTERISVDAERQSVKKMQVEYLAGSLGFEFPAVISGVTNFGIFVKLTETLAEGLIHVRDLGNEYFEFDEKKYTLTGRLSRRQYRLGDPLTVKLVRINKNKLELDFIVLNPEGENYRSQRR